MNPQELELIAKTISSLGENGQQAFTTYMIAWALTWVLHYLTVFGTVFGGLWVIGKVIRYGIDKSCET